MGYGRREFLRALGNGLAVLAALPLLGFGESSKLHFAQLRYAGDWDPRPLAYKRLMEAIEMRTSIKVSNKRTILGIGEDRVYEFPFLYITGQGEFPAFTDPERQRLRKFLSLGGTLLIDDASGFSDSPFYRGSVREMAAIFPSRTVQRLPSTHVIYRTFYLLDYASGRKIVKPFLQGLTFTEEERTPVIFCANDLGGAWSEDEFGRWRFACVPGGEAQREAAFRLGVNIAMYTLTGNYKKDKVHEPFIIRRKRSL